MTSFDIIVSIIIVFGAIRGYRQGFLMEIITLLAVIIGIVGGFKLLGSAMLWLHGSFDKSILPYVAFAIVFLFIVIGVSLLGRVIKSSIDKSFLGRIDQAMGALIGIFKLAFLTSIALWVMSSLSLSLVINWENTSTFYPFIQPIAPMVINGIGEIFPLFQNIL